MHPRRQAPMKHRQRRSEPLAAMVLGIGIGIGMVLFGRGVRKNVM